MIINQKSDLRLQIKAILSSLSADTKYKHSKNLTNKLWKKIKDYDVCMIFFSKSDEINTEKIIQKLHRHKKLILIPQIVKNNIVPVIYDENSILEKWEFAITQIQNYVIYTWEIDLIIVPWMAFDKEWNRLGRWKWFYDRFLLQYQNSHKIWICFPEQLIDYVPTNKSDITMDEIFTW